MLRVMNDITSQTLSELETGVSQTRLAELAGISTTTLRGYEKAGLIPSQADDGKKTYGPAAWKRLGLIKARKAEGIKLEDIAAELLQTQRTPEEMMAEVQRLRAVLLESQGKLKSLTQQVQDRVLTRRDDMRDTHQELQAIEDLRKSNLHRALQVERRTTALKHNIEYRRAGFSVTRIDLPQGTRKKK
jgi:DNA-binding transcriptional MerR regulator